MKAVIPVSVFCYVKRFSYSGWSHVGNVTPGDDYPGTCY